MKNFKAKLLRVRPLTDDVFHFDFEFSEGYEPFKAGQFFMLKIKDEQGMVNRSYSVASSPSEQGFFSLCVKLIPGGRGSELLRGLKVGDSAEFMAAFGHFVLAPEMKRAILVSTGTGLAPYMGMIPELFVQGFEGEIVVLFGVRHEKDLFYMEELQAWAKQHSNLRLIATLSQPEEDWTGEKGRVTDFVPGLLEGDLEGTHVYICGNGAMVKEVKSQAEAAGLTKERIHLEQFNAG
jgi:ferredoxin-NADP reductase